MKFLQHAVLFSNGEQYYGAKASINVWAPSVTNQYEFSLSQIWVISGSFGHDLNTIEAGWQACILFSFALYTTILNQKIQTFWLQSPKFQFEMINQLSNVILTSNFTISFHDGQ